MENQNSRPIFVQDYRGSKGEEFMVGTEEYPYYLLGRDYGDFKSGETIFSPYIGRVYLRVTGLEWVCEKIKKFNLLYYIDDRAIFLRKVTIEYQLVSVGVDVGWQSGNDYTVFI